MELVVNGKTYNIKEYACSPCKEFPFYINVSNICNAKCKFCSNECNKNFGKLNLEELEKIIDVVHEKISRFSISGGETLLNCDNLEDLLKLLKKYDPRITLNTNGILLEKSLSMLNKYPIESIQLSRHHYIDEKNNEVFQTKTISLDTIKKLKSKADLRINCLLIKNYIDSKEEVIKFLESLNDTPINQVGFISMMQVNEYTKDNFVNYKDIVDEFDEEFMLTKKMADQDRCTCDNYVYITSTGKPVFVYFRYTKKYQEGGRSLFYDSAGLKEGY